MGSNDWFHLLLHKMNRRGETEDNLCKTNRGWSKDREEGRSSLAGGADYDMTLVTLNDLLSGCQQPVLTIHRSSVRYDPI